MGYVHELTESPTPRLFHRARPGPVRLFNARSGIRGQLRLEWQPTAGAQFYRIERTRTGLEYEWLAETQETAFFIGDILLHDPWFYRVVAVNGRGAGWFTIVWFFERRGHGSGILMPVMVRPGLRVNICEFG